MAIVVDGLTKEFTVGSDNGHTLKERFLARQRSATSTFRALSNVNFDVRQGEAFGIVGHNGSGKSTLLKVMAGTYRPSSGSVKVRGRLAALLELGAGFHPDLTGRENIYLNASILGFSRWRVVELFDEIVDFAGVGDFIDLQVKHYSSGMTARLGFAVATNLEPDVLLIDEVLAVGDEAFQAKCMERVHRFRATGRTMVVVSHSPETVRDLCDRALVLEKGRMLYAGDVERAIEVYRAAIHGPPTKPASPSAAAPSDPVDAPAVSIARAAIERPDGASSQDSIPTFAPGDSIGVIIGYRVRRPTEFRVRLVMRTEDNSIMMNASTNEVLGRPVEADRDGEARFVLRRVPLLDGTYRLTVAIESVDGKITHDRIHVLGEFAIKGPGAGYGRVRVDVGCEIAAGEPAGGAGREAQLHSTRATSPTR